MKKNLVFINRFFFPDHSATSQILSDLAFGLAEKNIPISVITSRIHYESSKAILKKYEVLRGVSVYRVWTSNFGRYRLFGRAIDYLSFYAFAARMLWKLTDENTTVIVKTDPPLLSVVLTPIIKIKRGKQINWLQDLFPEVAENLEVKFLPKALTRLLKYLRNRSLQQSGKNIVLGSSMANYVASQNVSRDKIQILTNWADESYIRPIDNELNSLRKAWKLEDKFVIGYSGNLGRAHEFETILEAAKILDKIEDVVFLFIGGGAQRNLVENAVREYGLNRVIFKPYQNRDNLAESLSVANVHLISLNPKLERFIVPSKIYGVLAAGRPSIFIGDICGEVATLLNKYDCGYSVKPGDHNGLVNKIIEYKNNKTLLKKHETNAYTCFSNNFNKSLSINKFQAILK